MVSCIWELGELSSQGTPMTLLTAELSQRLGRTVVDKTGLDGDYAFNLHWTPDAEEQARIRAAGLPPELMKAGTACSFGSSASYGGRRATGTEAATANGTRAGPRHRPRRAAFTEQLKPHTFGAPLLPIVGRSGIPATPRTVDGRTGMYGPPLCRKRKMKVTGSSSQCIRPSLEHKLLALMDALRARPI